MPRYYVYAFILVFASLGTYAVSSRPFGMLLVLAVGLLGLGMRRYGWPVGPAVIGIILGPIAETTLHQALALSDGRSSVLWETTVSKVVLGAAVVSILVPLALRGRELRHRRRASAAPEPQPVPEEV